MINDCIEKRNFPDNLKLADVSLTFKKVSPLLKKKILLTKKIIDWSAYYHTCQKSLKGSFINKFILS